MMWTWSNLIDSQNDVGLLLQGDTKGSQAVTLKTGCDSLIDTELGPLSIVSRELILRG